MGRGEQRPLELCWRLLPRGKDLAVPSLSSHLTVGPGLDPELSSSGITDNPSISLSFRFPICRAKGSGPGSELVREEGHFFWGGGGGDALLTRIP